MAKKTTGQYDRIFKENAEEIYASLIKALLKIDASQVENLAQSDIQKTIERKADFLKKIVPTDGSPPYILHIEIQSDNDDAMLSRMILYKSLIFDRYGLDSKQFVIYLGTRELTMKSEILLTNCIYSYQIIEIKRYDYEMFLQASTLKK